MEFLESRRSQITQQVSQIDPRCSSAAGWSAPSGRVVVPLWQTGCQFYQCQDLAGLGKARRSTTALESVCPENCVRTRCFISSNSTAVWTLHKFGCMLSMSTMKERDRDFRYCLILAGWSSFKNQAISSRARNASSITLFPQNFKAQLSSLWQSHSLPQKCAQPKGVKGVRFEWPTIFVWHCVADVSLRDRSEVPGESLHTLLTLLQLGIAFHSPPVGSTEFYLWVKMVYLPCDGFPSSWCQVRIPWFITAF